MKNKIEEFITIPLEEYKELLIIKGKYEELKNKTYTTWKWEPSPKTPNITWSYCDHLTSPTGFTIGDNSFDYKYPNTHSTTTNKKR